ncbi:hypothetical protein L207DRAFT_567228 [Hyaloscypha variabilis F]|uniref:Uncharacterized protein n=1 Tax=Hyaloscypha variabilis (strain UAMH 11265 / GT02V1 / F) TaxID=1149755 RepID=A0A2J6RK58_HYAVF|nr:hypothetical protein L207DRAFT_567228 [Hyaloscypha variabilis F]
MAMSRNVRKKEELKRAATRVAGGKGSKSASTSGTMKAKAKAKAKAPKANRANLSSSSSSTTTTTPRSWPAPSHGRTSPYQPTGQKGGHYPKLRGNPPPNIGGDEWDKLYNCANSWRYARSPDDTQVEDAKAARENGSTRDFAIEGLILANRLPVGFIDNNP